jgi:DNA-binding transcriptional LysR family regulator
MDRMTSMTTFAKVVESGSFSAAARALQMSASMVTAHVQALETRLGVRLLNRNTRRISLTEIGQAYFDRCVHILAELDDAERGAQAMQSTPNGTLRLNASMAMPTLLAPVIAEFTALYPDVSVDMHRTDKLVDLVEEGFDLAVRSMALPESSLIVRRVACYRLLVCGAPAYLARCGTPRVPADLEQHNCLIYPHTPWGDKWLFNGPDGEQTIRVSGNMRGNSGNALRMAAVNGQGLCITPSFMVANEIGDGRLVPVLTDFLRTEYDVNAIYPHRHHLSAKVRTFLDLMIKRFRDNPHWADASPSAEIVPIARAV